MQCLILAGGLGTRMRPVTETVPKVLIPVLGRPFVDYQLQWLQSQGFDDVVLSVGYKGGMVRDHVGDGSKYGVRVSYTDEGEKLMGTGGALRVALDAGLLQESFFVLYGDSYLSLDLRMAWTHFEESGQPALMTVFNNGGQWETSNVIYDGSRIVLYDKRRPNPRSSEMSHVDYGLTGFRRDCIAERVPAGVKSDMAELLRDLSVEGRLAGFEVFERFYEIGSASGLADLEKHLVVQKPELKVTQ